MDDWLEELEHIRQHLRKYPRMAFVFGEQIILKVLDDLSQKYQLTVTIMESQLREGKLTLNGLTDIPRHEFKKIQKSLDK